MFDKKWFRGEFCYKHIISIICCAFIAIIGLLVFSSGISSQSHFSYFLNSRNYNYSVLINKNINENCYCYYDNTVTFASNESLDKNIKGTILMRTESIYNENDILFDCIDEFGPNDVVVSDIILRENNLKIGNKIYTKSKVDNSLLEFTIIKSIPYNYRIDSSNANIERGIIIFSYNSSYEESVVSNYLYFYDEDFSKINNESAIIIENSLIVKEDQIKSSKNIVLRDILISFLFSLVPYLIFNFVIMLINNKIYGFARIQGNKCIRKVIIKDFLFYNVAALIIAELAYLIISAITNVFNLALIAVPAVSCLISCVVGTFVTSYYLRRKY